jgi:TPP-dependent 2-oxoacid decarboxylase
MEEVRYENFCALHFKVGADIVLDDRIQQLGVGTVMGLPGDTNLELLHYIGSTDIHWGETQMLP